MNKIWSLFSGNSNILKFLLSPVRLKKSPGFYYKRGQRENVV
jgi:hypothetical protein